ncbi:MAG: hypothetical protein ACE5IK_00100 [Acidobacteriota bacterium]
MRLISDHVEGRRVVIHVHGAELDAHHEALSLNASFHEDVPLLKLQLTIDWEPTVPSHAIHGLEEQLAHVSPSLTRHQCRGQEEYRVRSAGTHTESRAATVEPALALAHLVEHVMIDVVAFITGARTVSGATGAPSDSTRPLDVFVECPDAAVGQLATHLALHWAVSLIDGESIDGTGRSALRLARRLYRHRPHPVSFCDATRQTHGDPARIGRALGWLEESGFACRVNYTLNFSGAPYYRVCPLSVTQQATVAPPRRREKTGAAELPGDGHRGRHGEEVARPAHDESGDATSR